MDQSFTQEEENFILAHDLPGPFPYVRHLTNQTWKSAAKAMGANFVVGNPCRRVGHRLRTRAGHCIQCDPSKINYQLRHSSPGAIYVANSSTMNLIKIGITTDIDNRESTLRAEGYAGTNDWVITYWRDTDNAGAIEQQVFRILRRFRTRARYLKGGAPQTAIELFSCPTENAKTAIDEVLGSKI